MRNRTYGVVRGGRRNPTPYSINQIVVLSVDFLALGDDFRSMSQVFGDATRQGIVVHDRRSHGIGNQTITNQRVQGVRRDGIELVLVLIEFKLQACNFFVVPGIAHRLDQTKHAQEITTDVRILGLDVFVGREAVLRHIHANLFHILQRGSHEEVGAADVHELRRVLGVLLCGARTHGVIDDVGVNRLKVLLIQVLEVFFRQIVTLRNDLAYGLVRINVFRLDVNHAADDVGRILHQALRFLRQRFDRTVAKCDGIFAQELGVFRFAVVVLALHEAIQAVAKLLDERQEQDHARHIKERREDGKLIDAVVRGDAEYRSDLIDSPKVLVDKDNRDDAAQDLEEDVRGSNLLTLDIGIQRADARNHRTTETGTD